MIINFYISIFTIIFPFTPWSTGLYLFPANTLYAFLISRMRATRPVHLILWFDH